MARRSRKSPWAKSIERAVRAMVRHTTRQTVKAGKIALKQAFKQAVKPAVTRHQPPRGAGDWLSGIALGAAGARNYRLYRPPGAAVSERLPLLVMLHGCGQDANSFATSTRMNRVAARERFFVLYPEQDRLSNSQGCWNWFETQSGRAFSEVSTLIGAIDQVCALYPVDRTQVAIAGLSAGASMAALLVSRHPGRFKAIAMHSGVAPGAAHSTMSALGAMRGYPTLSGAASKAIARSSTAASAKSPLPAAALLPTAAAWPPLLVIQGRADRVVDFSNGAAAAHFWAHHMSAKASAPRVLKRGNRHQATLTDFKLAGRLHVTLCEVDSLGHAWSGGNSSHPFGDDSGPDASRMVWAFAQRQFKIANPATPEA